MTVQIRLRTDPTGDPLISATFLLRRAPAAGERLSCLVDSATLALQLAADVPGADTLLRASATLLDQQAAVLARQETTDPFGTVGLAATLTAQPAVAALSSLLAGSPLLTVRVEAQLPEPPGPPGTIVIDLLGLWTVLDTGATPARSFSRSRLVEMLPQLHATGAVRVSGADRDPVAVPTGGGVPIGPDPVSTEPQPTGSAPEPTAGTPVHPGATAEPGATVESGTPQPGAPAAPARDCDQIDALLRAARWILTPVADDTWQLAETAPPAMTVTASLPAPTVGGSTDHGTRTLADLVAGELTDPTRFVHMVVAEGGRVRPLLPLHRTRGTRGPAAPLARGLRVALRAHPESDPEVVSVPAALAASTTLRPAATTVATIAAASSTTMDLQVHPLQIADWVSDNRHPGPVVTVGVAGAVGDHWPDRFSDHRGWYLPRHHVTLTDPAVTAEHSSFRFDVITVPGHDTDGRPSLEATITLSLQRGPSAEATSWAGDRTLADVPDADTEYQLAIPFVDEHGTARTETVRAASVTPTDGTVLVVFRLRDGWARLAYGALSTPDFQASPAQIVVSTTFHGWRATGSGHAGGQVEPAHLQQLAGLEKIRSLAQPRSARSTATRLPNLHALGTASIQPAWQHHLAAAAQILKTEYRWERMHATERIPLVVPCATHGHLYRSQDGEGWTEIGCQPAMRLGSIEYRTYQPVSLPAAEGWATVLRSLRTPATFLVVPDRYLVGWNEPDAVRPYAPQLLVVSSIDVDHPTRMRCTLAIGLQPDLPRYVRERILADARNLHAAPHLEFPSGVDAAPDLTLAVPGSVTVDWSPSSSGFDVVCESDIAGFLMLKALLDRDGVHGTVTLTLPGLDPLHSDVTVSTARLAGPFTAGPLERAGDADTLQLTNRIAAPVALTALERDGVRLAGLDSVVAPSTDVTVPRPDGGDVVPVYTPSSAGQPIEEVRAYIEDLELGVVFVAVSDPAATGATGFEVTMRFDDHQLPAVTLTHATRQQEVRLHLPLTRYVTDPQLTYQVHVVAQDGTRRSLPSQSWALRTQGALIPIDPPEE